MPARAPILRNRTSERLSESALDECIALLSLLDPAEPRRNKNACQLVNGPEITKSGKQFLDHLSWLCDPLPRGKTVAAIAVQENPDGPKFWIASNNGCRLSVRRHLKWLLETLGQLAEGQATRDSVFKKIFHESVKFSSERVQNYLAHLIRVASHCFQLQENHQTDRELSRAIQHILEEQQKQELVCMRAFEFRRSEASRILRSKAMATGPTGCWQVLRHYIGRMGSWWKAALIVTMTADGLTHHLRNATVHTIPVKPVDIHDHFSATKSLDDVLRSLFPDGSRDGFAAAKSAMQNRCGSSVNDKFTARLQSRRKQLCSHAEAAVLAHLHRRGCRFTASLPYIGCSKPSCFCCKLYADLHPLKTIPRESHGNTWVKWALPCPTRMKQGCYCRSCRCILQNMLHHLQREIRRRIFADGITVTARPESTTNMSSVAILRTKSSAQE